MTTQPSTPKCVCDIEFMQREPICAAYTPSPYEALGDDEFCNTPMPNGTLCGHNRACHSPTTPSA